MWPGMWKQGMLAHDFFNLSEFIALYPNMLWQWNFLQLVGIHYASCRTKILCSSTEICITFRVTGCSLCPHTQFSHAWLHIIMCIILYVSAVKIKGRMLPPRQAWWKKEHVEMKCASCSLLKTQLLNYLCINNLQYQRRADRFTWAIDFVQRTDFGRVFLKIYTIWKLFFHYIHWCNQPR